MEKPLRHLCLNPHAVPGFQKIASIHNWDIYTNSQKLQSDWTLVVAFDTSQSCQEFRLGLPSILLSNQQELEEYLLQKLVSNRLIDTAGLEPSAPVQP